MVARASETSATHSSVQSKLYEHLDYFGDGVAKSLKSAAFDFDEIFTSQVKSHPNSQPTVKCSVADGDERGHQRSSSTVVVPSPLPAVKTNHVIYETDRIVTPSSPTTVTATLGHNFTQETPKAGLIPAFQSTFTNQSSIHKRSYSELSASCEEQEEKRRERNRQHAKKSRVRRKVLTQTLEQSIADLKNENEKLMELLNGSPSSGNIVRNNRVSICNEEGASSGIIISDERFVAMLKKPSNQVVGKDTVAFLKTLSNNMQSKKQS